MLAYSDGGGGREGGREERERERGGEGVQEEGTGGWRNLNFFVEFVPSVPSYSFNTNCSAASPAQIHAALSSVLCLSSPGANHQQPHAKQMDGTPAVHTGDVRSFQKPHIALMKEHPQYSVLLGLA